MCNFLLYRALLRTLTSFICTTFKSSVFISISWQPFVIVHVLFTVHTSTNRPFQELNLSYQLINATSLVQQIILIVKCFDELLKVSFLAYSTLICQRFQFVKFESCFIIPAGIGLKEFDESLALKVLRNIFVAHYNRCRSLECCILLHCGSSYPNHFVIGWNPVHQVRSWIHRQS